MYTSRPFYTIAFASAEIIGRLIWSQTTQTFLLTTAVVANMYSSYLKGHLYYVSAKLYLNINGFVNAILNSEKYFNSNLQYVAEL